MQTFAEASGGRWRSSTGAGAVINGNLQQVIACLTPMFFDARSTYRVMIGLKTVRITTSSKWGLHDMHSTKSFPFKHLIQNKSGEDSKSVEMFTYVHIIYNHPQH